MNIQEIATLIATAGGIQGIAEFLRWWHSRKLKRREAEASIVETEYETGRKQTDWLEKRLADRDSKIDALYAELRKEQALRIGEIYSRHEIELRLTEAETRKCLIHGCQKRQPPTDY